MVFDASITLGNVLTMISIVGAGFVFVMTMHSNLTALGDRVGRVEGVMQQVTSALIQIAKQEERLNSHAERIARLESHD